MDIPNNLQHLQTIIEEAYDHLGELNAQSVPAPLHQAAMQVLTLLDRGILRVAEKQGESWVVHQWLKKAILVYFHIEGNHNITGKYTKFFDKVPLKFSEYGPEQFAKEKLRVVPPACVRKGAHIAANTVLMPSYVNIGAYVDEGTMIDTWATVGSCAQIGKRVHISGGAGIGGVLEPLQASPTIIEDDCFIGARSEVVEGVIVERGSVISMGVFIGQSTRIYDRETDTVSYGRVPAGSVIVPGSLPSKDGKYSLACAVIVKKVDNATRDKTQLNKILRELE